MTNELVLQSLATFGGEPVFLKVSFVDGDVSLKIETYETITHVVLAKPQMKMLMAFLTVLDGAEQSGR